MKRAEFSIFDWLYYAEITHGQEMVEQFLELKGTYDNVEITISTGAKVSELLQYLFSERKFVLPYSDLVIPTTSLMADDCTKIYQLWKTNTLPNFLRAFYALQSEYNPLNNYNGYEKIEISFGKTIDTEYGKKEDITHGKTNTLATDTYGYNSVNPAPRDAVTSTDGGSTGTEYSGTDGVTEGGTETHETTKNGNLGVTSSQQMINSEWELRKKDFAKDVIKSFVDEFTIY